MTDASDDDDKVGYRRPPREHRFRPGESGNPKGRPRKTRAIINVHDLLAKPIKVGTNRRPYYEVFLEINMKRALDGDKTAMRYIAKLMQESTLIDMKAESKIQKSMSNAKITLQEKLRLFMERRGLSQASPEEVGPHNGSLDETP